MKTSYKSAVLYSALFHVLILNFLFLNLAFFHKTNYVTESSVITANLVEIPKPTVKEANKTKEISIPKEEQKTPPAPQLKVKPKPVEKPAPAKPIEKKPEIKDSIKIDDRKTKIEKKPIEKKDVHDEKKPPVKPEKKSVTDKKKTITKAQKNQKTMEEKLWAEQLANEEKQLSQAKAQQAQGVVNKYNALILQAIREQWILPENYPPEVSCQLLIKLKPGGGVLDVQLVKSSGNEGFDRSARAAVYKASPLPVPKETDLFNQMREIALVVRP